MRGKRRGPAPAAPHAGRQPAENAGPGPQTPPGPPPGGAQGLPAAQAEPEAKKQHKLQDVLIWTLIAGIILLVYLAFGCPIRLATGVPCPGCGMSRAVASLLIFSWGGAFYYHPLVFMLPLFLWAVAGRGGVMAKPRVRLAALGGMAALFVAVWLLRLLVFRSPVLALGRPGLMEGFWAFIDIFRSGFAA